jgi:predicted RNA binding protein YcfA (HicA-like mRNA interferase family)
MAAFVSTPDSTPAGYQPPTEGPFKCSNCEYFTEPDRCSKTQVIKELGGKGFATVDPEGCCNFYSKDKSGADTMPFRPGSQAPPFGNKPKPMTPPSQGKLLPPMGDQASVGPPAGPAAAGNASQPFSKKARMMQVLKGLGKA